MEIKTLNEQIERLRALVRKCYGAVAGKNGTVPEVGERNMENLPAAIGSIKSASEVPKVKVTSFTVKDDCINEEGRWGGEGLIDISNLISLKNVFSDCYLLKELDVSDWDVSNVTDMSSMFRGCTSLKHIDVSNWDTRNLEIANSMFSWSQGMNVNGLENFNTQKLKDANQMFVGGLVTKVVDFTNWDFGNVTNASDFADGWRATSLVGGRTLEDVISNDIKVFKNLKVSTRYLWYTENIDSASLVAIINGLADLTGQTPQTLAFSSMIGTKLDAEQIAGMPAKDYLAGKASAKNWTISY
jgi:surface protein